MWQYRERLAKAGIVEELFDRFDSFLRARGYQAKGGQIVEVPRQCNSKGENAEIKAGEIPEGWAEDLDARWTKKGGMSYYGYKNHVSTDRRYKLVRRWAVTDASVHDSQVIEKILDPDNTAATVWADKAYRSEEIEEVLEELGYKSMIMRKGSRGRKLTKREKQGNGTKAKVRARVEHVAARTGVLRQHAHHAHREAGRAEGALEPALVHDGLLHGVKPPVLLQPLDGGDLAAPHRVRQNRAAVVCDPVEQHGACPALGPVAAQLGAGQAHLVAQRHRERFLPGNVRAALLAVDVEGEEPLHRALGGQHRRDHAAVTEQVSRSRCGGARSDHPLDELAAGEATPSRLNALGCQHRYAPRRDRGADPVTAGIIGGWGRWGETGGSLPGRGC